MYLDLKKNKRENMDIIDSLKKACLALSHWTTYTRLIMPDYPFNEGAIVVQLWKALASIDRENHLKFGFEVEYRQLINKLGFGNITNPQKLRADIVVETAEMHYVIEVKSAYNKSIRCSRSVPQPVRDDIIKIANFAEVIKINKVRGFVLYLTQKSCINTALTYAHADSVSEKAIGRAKRSLPHLDGLVGESLCVKVRNVSKSTSSVNRTVGDYCYLLEVMNRKVVGN